jgi:LHFPL tetraspan subfamily member protein
MPNCISACIDGCILATLAFILATKHVRLQAEPTYQNSMYKGNVIKFTIEKTKNVQMTKRICFFSFAFSSGEVNNAYITDISSMGGSRKSLNLQPVLLVTPPHHMAPGGDDSHSVSQFSSRTAPRFNRQADFHHHNPMHQFQL